MKGSLPGPRCGMAMFNAFNKIYLIGGIEGKEK